MEPKNKRAVIVGIFVFVALVIFVLGVMTLGGQKNLFNKGATLHAIFDEVGGLQKGNNVWYAGMKLGTVKALGFNKQGQVDVVMNITEAALPFLKKDIKAKVGSDGFIGNKIIVLYGGSAGAPVVENGSFITSEKSIGAEEMMATLQENNKNILAITQNFKAISTDMLNGQGSIGKLLKDEKLFADLAQSVSSIRLAAANAQLMVADVADYTNKLQSKGSLANDLITDTVIFSRLRSTVKEIDALSETANKVIDNLHEASNHINKSLADPNSAAGLLLNDSEVAGEIRKTIKNLQSSTYKLDENMEALQHNFLLRGFFKKKNAAK